MKAILMSIRPQWVAKILNGLKTIEIRKMFPSDYVGWVYIYVTKRKDRLVWDIDGHICIDNEHYAYGDEELNGKVVARFWCDKVEEIDKDNLDGEYWKEIEYWKDEACLTYEELCSYLKGKNGYAISITKLEIFNEPKEIKDFSVYSHSVIGTDTQGKTTSFKILKPLSCAPQSWCYIYE